MKYAKKQVVVSIRFPGKNSTCCMRKFAKQIGNCSNKFKDNVKSCFVSVRVTGTGCAFIRSIIYTPCPDNNTEPERKTHTIESN